MHKFDYLPYIFYIDTMGSMRKSYYNFNKPVIPGIESVYFLLSITFLIILIIFIIFFILNFVRYKKNEIENGVIIFGIFIIAVFLFNFFISLTSSMIYCLDVDRYIDDQFILVILSNFLALIYIFLYNPILRIKEEKK